MTATAHAMSDYDSRGVMLVAISHVWHKLSQIEAAINSSTAQHQEHHDSTISLLHAIVMHQQEQKATYGTGHPAYATDSARVLQVQGAVALLPAWLGYMSAQRALRHAPASARLVLAILLGIAVWLWAVRRTNSSVQTAQAWLTQARAWSRAWRLT